MIALRASLAVAAACLATAGCAFEPRAPEPARTVSLRVTGTPPDATVTIDDILVGPLNVVAARGVALPVGLHHMSVEASGYLPWDKELDARDAPVKVDAQLQKVPD